jgi:hypothetical protein
MKSPLLFLILIVAGFLLTACEGDFPGERPFNIEATNSPVGLKEIPNWRGTGDRLLAVMNTNADSLRYQTGALHFYEISVGGDLTRRTELDMAVPPLTWGFEFYEDYLFLADRNALRLRVYEWSDVADAYQELEIQGELSMGLETFSNPRDLKVLSSQVGKDYLVVSHFDSGALQFFDIEELRWLTRQDLIDRLGGEAVNAHVYRRDPLIAGRLFLSPGSGDLSGASGLQREGRGTNTLQIFGGAEDWIFVVSEFANVVFGFRFDTFRNTSNFLWTLRREERGYRQNSVRINGTRDRGFRGSDLDGQNNLFLASRADNRIYRISADELTAEPGLTSNTLAFSVDSQTLALAPQPGIPTGEANFPIQRADEIFPRLGDLVVNGKLADAAATKIWVLGYEGERGFDTSRLYLLELDGNNPPRYRIVDELEFPAGERPQKLTLLEDVDRLVVTAFSGDKVYLIDASTLDVEGELL